jgi:hypothetical protein
VNGAFYQVAISPVFSYFSIELTILTAILSSQYSSDINLTSGLVNKLCFKRSFLLSLAPSILYDIWIHHMLLQQKLQIKQLLRMKSSDSRNRLKRCFHIATGSSLFN